VGALGAAVVGMEVTGASVLGLEGLEGAGEGETGLAVGASVAFAYTRGHISHLGCYKYHINPNCARP
jgi:hypothetical protein